MLLVGRGHKLDVRGVSYVACVCGGVYVVECNVRYGWAMKVASDLTDYIDYPDRWTKKRRNENEQKRINRACCG